MFSAAFQTAVKNGMAYSWSSPIYDPDALDTILMVSNEHTGGFKLNIERVDFNCDTLTEYVIHLPTYATWAGTLVTGVNLNADSSNTAIATAKADETGQASRGSVIGNGGVIAGAESQNWVLVKLGYQKAIAIDVIEASTAALATIWGYYSAT